MFFVTKSGVSKEITKMVGPLVYVVDSTGGIPVGFWEDKQILGFITGQIFGLTSVISGNKYKGSDGGEITMDVLDKICPGQGLRLSKIATTLFRDPLFAKSVKAGALSVLVAKYGPSKVLDEPLVQEAIRHSKSLPDMSSITGAIPESANLASALQDLFYYRCVDALRNAAVS